VKHVGFGGVTIDDASHVGCESEMPLDQLMHVPRDDHEPSATGAAQIRKRAIEQRPAENLDQAFRSCSRQVPHPSAASGRDDYAEPRLDHARCCSLLTVADRCERG
jgi:hypothetical protein